MAPGESCWGGRRWGLRGKEAVCAKGTNHSLSENYLWKVDTNFRPLINLTDGNFGGGREGETGREKKREREEGGGEGQGEHKLGLMLDR